MLAADLMEVYVADYLPLFRTPSSEWCVCTNSRGLSAEKHKEPDTKSASFLAEVPVSSPRKLFIFIM